MTALAAYADHFREKGDWPALVDLLEFALEQARATGALPEELVTRLEEIATVSEKNLGDPRARGGGVAADRGAGSRRTRAPATCRSASC